MRKPRTEKGRPINREMERDNTLKALLSKVVTLNVIVVNCSKETDFSLLSIIHKVISNL